jgi:hypothetical protein
MIKNVGEGVFNGVVRAKGHLWVASANAYPVDIHIAGKIVDSKVLLLSCAASKNIRDKYRHRYMWRIDQG